MHTSDELKTCLLTQFLSKTARNFRQHRTTSPGLPMPMLLLLLLLRMFSASGSAFPTLLETPESAAVAAAPAAAVAFCGVAGWMRSRDGSLCIALSMASSVRSRTSHLRVSIFL